MCRHFSIAWYLANKFANYIVTYNNLDGVHLRRHEYDEADDDDGSKKTEGLTYIRFPSIRDQFIGHHQTI